MYDDQQLDPYQPPSPAGAFLQIMLGVIFLLLIIVGLVAGWGTFLKAAPVLVQILVVLVAIAGPGTVIAKGGKNLYLDVQHMRAVHIRVSMDEAQLHAMEDARWRENHKAEAEAERIRAEAERIRAEAEKVLSSVEWDDQGNAARWDPQTRRMIQLQGQMREHPSLSSLHYRSDYRDTATRVREEQQPHPLLTAGELRIPTFSESLATGEIGPGQRDMLFCYEIIADDVTGQVSLSPIRGAIGEQHTQLVVAGSQSGKTTYMANNMGQAAILRSLFYVIDPHRNHPEKSIAAKMGAFKDWFILPPAMTHDEIRRLLAHATRVRDERIAGKPTPYDGYHIMVVVDEVPALMANQRSSDKQLRQVYLNLALFMQSLGIQTAKFGMTGLFASQFATKEHLGEIDFRDACMSQLIMRLHPTQAQAMRILGPSAVREIPKFRPGHGFLLLSDATEVRRVVSGNVTAQDLAYLANLLPPSPLAKLGAKAGRKQSESGTIIPMRDDVEPPLFAAESRSNVGGKQVGNDIPDAVQAKLDGLGIPASSIMLKVDRVSELLGHNKGDIMRAVWNVTPGRSKAYEDAEVEYALVMEIIKYHQAHVRMGRQAQG